MTSLSESPRPQDRDAIEKQITLGYQHEQTENSSFLRDLAKRDWDELSEDERAAISYIGQLLEPHDTTARQNVIRGMIAFRHICTEADVVLDLDLQFGDVVPHPLDQKPVTPID